MPNEMIVCEAVQPWCVRPQRSGRNKNIFWSLEEPLRMMAVSLWSVIDLWTVVLVAIDLLMMSLAIMKLLILTRKGSLSGCGCFNMSYWNRSCVAYDKVDVPLKMTSPTIIPKQCFGYVLECLNKGHSWLIEQPAELSVRYLAKGFPVYTCHPLASALRKDSYNSCCFAG